MATTPSKKPVDFVGDTGPGAMIDQYLPQPGQHVGRRILKIEDIPESWFLDSASTAGESWADRYGLEKSDDLWQLRDPSIFTSEWLSQYSQVRRLAPGTTKSLELTLSTQAREALGASGSLLPWARKGGGAPVLAKLSTAPDAAGNTEPADDDVPDVDTDDPAVDDATGALGATLNTLEYGVLTVPGSGLWGIPSENDVDLEEEPVPHFFIIQVVGISSFLGDYGLGKTVKTDSLFPGETKTVHLRTWRSTQESVSAGSSIIDSYDEASITRFQETVTNETTDTATQDKTENWFVEAEAGGSLGFASASVSGGGGGEYSSGTEEFARSLDEAVNEHTSEASSHRENTVSSSTESTTASEDEEIIERTLQNINVGRVLNFTFRELNQEYTVKTHLKGIRIAFSNGNAGAWREEPISGLRKLVEEYIAPQHVDQVCSDILGTVAVSRDAYDSPVRVLEQVLLDQCGLDFRARDAEPGDDCVYPAPTAGGRMYYRFKRGPLGQAPDEEYPVDGVVLSERTLVMKTDSVAVEALLGLSAALDHYSETLQLEAIREKQLANDREELALALIKGGKSAEAELYAQIYGVCCSDSEPTVEGESA